jgi:hypothetical protein
MSSELEHATPCCDRRFTREFMVMDKPVQARRQHGTDGKGYKQLNVFDKASLKGEPGSGSGRSPTESKTEHGKVPSQSKTPAGPDMKRALKPAAEKGTDRMCEMCDFRYKIF